MQETNVDDFNITSDHTLLLQYIFLNSVFKHQIMLLKEFTFANMNKYKYKIVCNRLQTKVWFTTQTYVLVCLGSICQKNLDHALDQNKFKVQSHFCNNVWVVGRIPSLYMSEDGGMPHKD